MIIVMLTMLFMSSTERKFWEKGCLLSMRVVLDVTGHVTASVAQIVEAVEDVTREPPGWTNMDLLPGLTTGWWLRT